MGLIEDAFFPRRCLCCDKVIEMGAEPSFCKECLENLIEYNYEISDFPYEKLFAKYLYEDTASFVIKKIKHTENKEILRWVSEELKKLVEAKIAVKIDLIVGVPRFSTGKPVYSSSQKLAERLSKALDVDFGKNTLSKIKNTKSQTSCKEMADRFENVKGAFVLNDDVCGKTVLVVDDTLTSGATMNEIGKLLSEGGAVCYGVAFAKTKMHGSVLGKFNPDYEILSKEEVFFPFSKCMRQVKKLQKKRYKKNLERRLNKRLAEKPKETLKKLFKRKKRSLSRGK